MKNKPQRRSSVDPSTDENFKAQVIRLRDILKDLSSGKYLREFFNPRDLMDSIWFLMDVLEFEDLVEEFEKGSHPDNRFLYTHMHRVYKKYIKTESKLELSPSSIQSIQERCAAIPIRKNVFQAGVDEVIAGLLKNHFGDFLSSVQYEEYAQVSSQAVS